MPATILDSRSLHIVLRGPLSAMGVDRERGEVVDTTEWRNVQPLINVRRLEALAYGAEPVACPCGRSWVDEQSSLNHKCPARRRRKES